MSRHRGVEIRRFWAGLGRCPASVPGIVLRSNVIITMRLLHVLLAVALTLGFIGAGRIVAFVERRGCGMLVVDMTIPFFFSGPTTFKVLAIALRALPRAYVRLFVLPVLR